MSIHKRFGCLLLVWGFVAVSSLALVACSSAQVQAASPPRAPVAVAAPPRYAEAGVGVRAKVGPLPPEGAPQPAPPPAEPPLAPPLPALTSEELLPELLQMEGQLDIEVDELEAPLELVRTATRDLGGQVVNEVLESQGTSRSASLSIRVPVAQTRVLMDRIAAVGRVRLRKLESQELGRSYADAQVLLRNLESTMQRFEQLLGQAETVADMTALQEALARVRTDIDRVRSDIAWMSDQAARSTLYVTLTTNPEWVDEPQVKLWPGLRLIAPIHFLKGRAETYAGTGVSFFFDRAFSFDVDWAKPLRSPSDGAWFAVSLGGEMYSDFLGAGRRAFLNPHLGFRAAYIHTRGANEGAAGGSVGVELFRSTALLLDLDNRIYAVFGSPERGLHAFIQPSLTLHVAF